MAHIHGSHTWYRKTGNHEMVKTYNLQKWKSAFLTFPKLQKYLCVERPGWNCGKPEHQPLGLDVLFGFVLFPSHSALYNL